MSKADRQRATRAQRSLRGARGRRRVSTPTLIGIVAVVAFAVAVGVGVTLAGRHPASPSAAQAGGPGPVIDLAQLPGLQTSPAPWQPEYSALPARLAAVHLPDNGDESYHIHAHLAIYVNGQPVPVPANVGISQAARLESPMHTHDTTGVIHIEASQPSTAFTLGAFLDLWGVPLTDTQLGGYHTTGDQAVHAYVNGNPVTDPARYPLQPHDDIVLGYGTADSFPHTANFTWPQGE